MADPWMLFEQGLEKQGISFKAIRDSGDNVLELLKDCGITTPLQIAEVPYQTKFKEKRDTGISLFCSSFFIFFLWFLIFLEISRKFLST
jgi:hypothetical protein